nr:MAG TPA: hypothetical protein [Caudoviricetes sp.]
MSRDWGGNMITPPFKNGIDMGSKKRTKTAWFSFYLT